MVYINIMKGGQTMRNFLTSVKGKLSIMMVCALACIMSAISVFADVTGTANTEVVSAMSQLSADMVATATSIIPLALTVVGISMVVVFGIRIFKSIAHK